MVSSAVFNSLSYNVTPKRVKGVVQLPERFDDNDGHTRRARWAISQASEKRRDVFLASDLPHLKSMFDSKAEGVPHNQLLVLVKVPKRVLAAREAMGQEPPQRPALRLVS